jgi:hypothetical protein
LRLTNFHADPALLDRLLSADGRSGEPSPAPVSAATAHRSSLGVPCSAQAIERLAGAGA